MSDVKAASLTKSFSDTENSLKSEQKRTSSSESSTWAFSGEQEYLKTENHAANIWESVL